MPRYAVDTEFLAIRQRERLRRRIEMLDPERRRELYIRHERHMRACSGLGIGPDPLWLQEAIEDLFKGRSL